MDFIEGQPKSEGYSIILVVVDRFTKYAHFFASQTSLYCTISSIGFLL
jgi:hypothetical protein